MSAGVEESGKLAEADAQVYRGFRRALGDKIASKGKEIRDLVATQCAVDDYEARRVPLAVTAPDLAQAKIRLSLAWASDDPQQTAASERFPDAKPFDAASYLRPVFDRFRVEYGETQEAYESLLRVVLDEQAKAMESNSALEKAKADCAEARAQMEELAERAKLQGGRLKEIDTALRGWAAEAKIETADADSTEDVLAKLRSGKPSKRETTGYCDAILRTIARKCDVADVDALSSDELVRQISDTLDVRLIPKGMRLRKVGSR